MNISKEEVLHIANLAKLEIKDGELEEYKEEMGKIVSFVDTINTVDIEEFKTDYCEIKNSFRKDEIVNFNDRELLFKNAKNKDNNMFKIPKVF